MAALFVPARHRNSLSTSTHAPPFPIHAVDAERQPAALTTLALVDFESDSVPAITTPSRGLPSATSSISTDDSPYRRSSTSTRASSFTTTTSATSYASVPTLVKTRTELERSPRPLSAWKRPPPPAPSRPRHAAIVLPADIYDCIFSFLASGLSGPAARVRALYNLSLTCRAWDRASRRHL